jgi:predicted DCC family thiol-disulfide oxidoreductase YuxK
MREPPYDVAVAKGPLMNESGDRPYSGSGVLFYDADCGFCRWCVTKVLAWDRNRSIVPLAIASPESAALLADIEPERHLASWHFRDPSGTVSSAGAAFAPLLRLLPGGSPLAAFASRFPRAVERAYRVVASNRGVLGALVTSGARARADRRLAAHDGHR